MRRTIITVLAASVGLTSATALAQEAAAPSTPQLDTVTVKARKVEENIQSAPLAVTALVEELIEDARLENFQDFVLLVPGATFQQGNFNDVAPPLVAGRRVDLLLEFGRRPARLRRGLPTRPARRSPLDRRPQDRRASRVQA